jgi:hypothetical protein
VVRLRVARRAPDAPPRRYYPALVPGTTHVAVGAATLVAAVEALERGGEAAAAPLVAAAAAVDAELARPAVPNSNLQSDFNLSVFERFDASSSALLRELDASNRFVHKSAESTSM